MGMKGHLLVSLYYGEPRHILMREKIMSSAKYSVKLKRNWMMIIVTTYHQILKTKYIIILGHKVV